MPHAARRNVSLKVAIAGLAVGAAGLGAVALAAVVPAVTSAPGYSRLPAEPCDAVSADTLRQAIGEHETSKEIESDTSATCEWRNSETISEVGDGRFGRLQVGYDIELDGDRPEPSEAQDAVQRIVRGSEETENVDLGDHAVQVFDPHNVRLVVSRANLLITVEYDAVRLKNMTEQPLSRAELAAVARKAAVDALGNADAPD